MKQYVQYVYRDNDWRAVGAATNTTDGIYYIAVSGTASTTSPSKCAAL